jgi:hypothetical protein
MGKIESNGDDSASSPSPSSLSSSVTSAIQNKNYLVSKLRPSDHKPVSASFTVETRVIDKDKEKAEYLRLVRHLDRMENEIQPKVEVGPLLDLQYQSVRFQVSLFVSLVSFSPSLISATGEEVCCLLHHEYWLSRVSCQLEICSER